MKASWLAFAYVLCLPRLVILMRDYELLVSFVLSVFPLLIKKIWKCRWKQWIKVVGIIVIALMWMGIVWFLKWQILESAATLIWLSVLMLLACRWSKPLGVEEKIRFSMWLMFAGIIFAVSWGARVTDVPVFLI